MAPVLFDEIIQYFPRLYDAHENTIHFSPKEARTFRGIVIVLSRWNIDKLKLNKSGLIRNLYRSFPKRSEGCKNNARPLRVFSSDTQKRGMMSNRFWTSGIESKRTSADIKITLTDLRKLAEPACRSTNPSDDSYKTVRYRSERFYCRAMLSWEIIILW